MSTFKVGDRVVVTSRVEYVVYGKIGTLKGTIGDWLVEFDEYLGLHGGHDRITGKMGHCYWLVEQEFTVLPKATKLNKKLYPTYVEHNGYILPEEIAAKLNEESSCKEKRNVLESEQEDL